MELPVTLVIKAPNQRIGDQTVDCMLDWTVRRLKQHLTDVYPSRPNETHQKLIYSGKLLLDHLTLKEVLRQFDDGSTKHTVHLVCAAAPGYDGKLTNHRMESRTHSRQSSASSSSVDGSPEYEGLRHRGHRNPSPSNSQSSVTDNQNVFNPYSPQIPGLNQFPANMNQFGAGFPAEAAMFPGMMPDAGMAYSPEQYMWMQQMYAQYMAQYMQYYQQGYQVPPNTPVTPSPGQAGPQQQNAQENGNQPQEVADDMDDLDEEFRQRDWLDYLYTFSRFMVLLGIVYFYSNLTRFLMVAAFFFVVYAYQMGWFMFGRRQGHRQNNNDEQRPEPQNPAPQRGENEEQQQQQDNNIEQNDADSPEEPANPTESPVQELPQEPGVVRVTWTFFSTFFTSLFPSPPPAVNVN